MEKGINLRTFEFKENLTKLINESGLPACVLSMTLNETQAQVNAITNQAIANEKAAFEKGSEEDGGNADHICTN